MYVDNFSQNFKVKSSHNKHPRHSINNNKNVANLLYVANNGCLVVSGKNAPLSYRNCTYFSALFLEKNMTSSQ